MASTSSKRGIEAFQSRDFRRYQIARIGAIIGGEAQSVGVAWQVYNITHSALALGYTGLALFLPGMLFILPSGHVADRYDRRLVVLICYSLQLVCTAALFGFAWYGMRTIWPVYLVLLLIGTGRAFSGPASSALLPHLVPKEHFVNAVTWGATIWQISNIVGPAIGGILFTLPMAGRMIPARMTGAPIVYLFTILTLLWFVMLVLSLDVRPGRMEHHDISLDVLHTGPRGLGLLRAAPAAGALVISLLLTFRPIAGRAGAKMFVCVAIYSAATIVFGLSRNLFLSLIALGILGAADMISVVVRNSLLQLATPLEMRGRVSAVNALFVGGSNELGEFESGLTAQWMGAVRAVLAGGIGSLVVTGLWSVLFPTLRQVDELTEESILALNATQSPQL